MHFEIIYTTVCLNSCGWHSRLVCERSGVQYSTMPPCKCVGYANHYFSRARPSTQRSKNGYWVSPDKSAANKHELDFIGLGTVSP